jgi:hypothetical protein
MGQVMGRISTLDRDLTLARQPADFDTPGGYTQQSMPLLVRPPSRIIYR